MTTKVKRDNNGECEQDARIALLQHYSSKSSNQVTSGLTYALVLFAFVASIDTLRSIGAWLPFLSVLVIISLVALTVHTAFRLFYWGDLAGYATSVDFVTTDYLKKNIAAQSKADDEKDYFEVRV